MLHLIEGPAGGGKSQVASDMLAAGQVDLLADTTALWAAIGGYTRDPETGRYPVRQDDDPALHAARYIQAAVVSFAVREGLNVAITASRRNQAERWRQLAERIVREAELDEALAQLSTTTVEPTGSIDVVRARLADPVTGELSPECEAALQRWYE